MKNKKILLGSLVTVVAGTLLVTSILNKDADLEREYSPRETSVEANNDWSGANELYKRLRANVNTGEVSRQDYLNAFNQVKNMNFTKAQTMSWSEHGPDNIGGRTRAILIDKDDSLLIYAGSVSGGLWKSTLSGTTWSKVEAFDENLGISSMCQTDDGKIYVATGHSAELSGGTGGTGYNGNGVYVTSDGGASF